MKKLLAFTLAETLIVIGIIGVVSALTLPNLNSSTGEKEKVAKVKKIYQNLDDAVGRAVAVYGPLAEWPSTGDASEYERIVEFMKISKKVDNHEYILADGSSVYFSGQVGCYSDMVSSSYPGQIICFELSVDIDGPNKGKNKPGYDMFYFIATESGVFPDNTSTDTTVDGKPASKREDGSYYATAWVIMNENMDYLKCFDKLNWTNQTSCK